MGERQACERPSHSRRQAQLLCAGAAICGRQAGPVGFVVETTGYNDKTWLDFSGHPHTDALRMTERFRRIDIGHLEIQFTFDDPKAYTKPWTVTINPQLFMDGDLLESICTDNEKDLHRVTGK